MNELSTVGPIPAMVGTCSEWQWHQLDICNAYSLRPPARSPPAGDMGSPHLHSTHLQSSSLHDTIKAVDQTCLLYEMTKVYYMFVVDLIGHIIFGTVIQEVRTSNVAREVGTLQAFH